MKEVLITVAACTAAVSVALFVNYKLAIEPARAEREVERQALTELIVNGNRAEAAVILTGRENARFQVIAQEMGK